MEYISLREELDEIRVVTILPATADGLVHCTIKAVSLLDRIENDQSEQQHGTSTVQTTEVADRSQYRFRWGDYACLSYTWGDPTRTVEIVANGCQILVTVNLEACLRAMQKQSMFDSGFKVWIDAICINQADSAERGVQVNKMRELYSEAWSVVIWLGEESEDSEKAIKLLETLSRLSDHWEKDGHKSFGLSEKVERLRLALKNDPEYLGKGSWVALREFLARPYWDRLWIIQEVLISSTKIILCGSLCIDWDTLCAGLGTIHRYFFNMKNELLEHDQRVCRKIYTEPWNTKNLHRVVKDLWRLGNELKKGGKDIYLSSQLLDGDLRLIFVRKPLDIHRLLEISKQSLASDARDKVYGLLAIIEPEFARKIKPSYDMNTGDVFNMAAKAHIETYNSLEILKEANPWGGSGSASWAPDWTWEGRNRFWMHTIPYKASGKTTASARFSEEEKVLTCRGIIIDTIDGLGPRRRGSSEGIAHASELWEFKTDTMVQPQLTAGPDIDTEKLKMDLCRALARDRSWEVPDNQSTWHLSILNMPADEGTALKAFSDRGAGWAFLASEKNYYHRWELWRKAHATFMICRHKLDDLFVDRIPHDALPHDYSAAYQAAKGSTQSQRLVVTEKGRVGWVPDNNASGAEDQVQRGDLFCVVFGCSTPIVMRKHLDGFLVLGEGYLQGMMEGEALQCVEDGDFCVQDLKIF
jgi:hypothetical protein